jgi:serine/threonine-protein kinase
MIGTVIADRYRLVAEIAKGGMGTVYEATHRATGRRVAVKLIANPAPSRETAARFRREARAIGSLDARHIVPVLDAGTDRATGRPFLVMALMRGEDLMALSRRTGPVATDLALKILSQACAGLSSAHAAGVIHRDIKPANLFLSHEANDEVVVKLLDFGVAKLTGDVSTLALTTTGTMVGSPHYMSPEQARGSCEVDQRADIWSLGVVAYRLLSGRLPFEHARGLGNLLLTICSTPVPALRAHAPWVRPEVAAIVHRALSTRPMERFASADAMRNAIRVHGPDDTIRVVDLPIHLSENPDDIDTLPWLPTTRPPDALSFPR